MYVKACSATGAFEQILTLLKGAPESAPRGLKIKEILNCSIEITDPRNRLIQTPERKMNLSYAVGELLWYLSGRNDLATMQYYSRRMESFSDDGLTLNSAYGYRIFGNHQKIGFDQWENVKSILTRDKDSRQAIIHLHTPNDKPTRDEVCTLSLQFLIREDKLNMITNMRANDIVFGFTYDVFAFTMLQEIMANELGIEVGSYYHNAGSMHIYERDYKLLDYFTYVMPFPMGKSKFTLNSYKRHLLSLEEFLRDKEQNEMKTLINLHMYYSDDICHTEMEKMFALALCLWFVKRTNYATIKYANDIINEARKVHEGWATMLANGCGIFSQRSPKPLRIIVDGIDGSGKSTLVNAIYSNCLAKGFKPNVQHFDRPTKNFNYFDDYMATLRLQNDMILDRFFTSEIAYNGNTRLSSQGEETLTDICCNGDTIFVLFCFEKDTMEQIYSRMNSDDKAKGKQFYQNANIGYRFLAARLAEKNVKLVVVKNPNFDPTVVVNQIFMMDKIKGIGAQTALIFEEERGK